MPRYNRRNKDNRALGKSLHILFEDEKSSRCYIQGYKNNFRYGRNIKLIRHKSRHSDPEHLVEDAIAFKSSFPDDEIWVVYDAENSIQRSIAKHHTAWTNARRNGIKITISSVSYETWVLLHHYFTASPFNDSEQLESHIRHNYQADYDKADENIFVKLKDKLSNALQNAENLARHNNVAYPHKKPYEINPYTDFYKLLEAIDKFAEENP